MALLYGISQQPTWLTGTIGANSRVLANQFIYRRSDDYYLAYNGLPQLFGTLTPSYITTTFTGTDADGLRVDYVATATSTGTTAFRTWGAITGNLTNSDPRVTLSMSTLVSTASLFSDVPTQRWESNVIVESTTNTWNFKIPLLLSWIFNYDGTTYTVNGGIPSTSIAESDPGDNLGVNGRFVHAPTNYGSSGARCAVHGTTLPTYASEVAHNSLAFTLTGGATSTTFNVTRSVVALSPSFGGSLPYTGNSEVAGAHAGRVYYPAITRFSAQYDDSKLRVDLTSTVSPTANVIGVFLRNISAPTGSGRPAGSSTAGALPLVDHYEVNGAPIAVTTTAQGVYVPATVFDIVFKDTVVGQSGYIEMRAVIDSPTFPPESEFFSLNWQMALPALLYVVAAAVAVGFARAIIRPYGELKTRPKHILAQQPVSVRNNQSQWSSMARFYSLNPSNGVVASTDDEGATFQDMANAWTGVSGAKPLDYAISSTGIQFTIAKVGTNIVLRRSFDGGATWETPSGAAPTPAGTSTSWNLALHDLAGKTTVTVTDGLTRVDNDALGEGGAWVVVS